MASENKWNPEKVRAQLVKVMTQRVKLACVVVQDEAKRLINVKNPGGNPSQPGEPPKKITGALQRSVDHRVVVNEKDGPIGAVAATRVGARRLELGFVGTDSAGRMVKQAPRPYLRAALRNKWGQLKQILGAK